jgi:hypothetical protein
LGIIEKEEKTTHDKYEKEVAIEMLFYLLGKRFKPPHYTEKDPRAAVFRKLSGELEEKLEELKQVVDENEYYKTFIEKWLSFLENNCKKIIEEIRKANDSVSQILRNAYDENLKKWEELRREKYHWLPPFDELLNEKMKILQNEAQFYSNKKFLFALSLCLTAIEICMVTFNKEREWREKKKDEVIALAKDYTRINIEKLPLKWISVKD